MALIKEIEKAKEYILEWLKMIISAFIDYIGIPEWAIIAAVIAIIGAIIWKISRRH